MTVICTLQYDKHAVGGRWTSFWYLLIQISRISSCLWLQYACVQIRPGIHWHCNGGSPRVLATSPTLTWIDTIYIVCPSSVYHMITLYVYIVNAMSIIVIYYLSEFSNNVNTKPPILTCISTSKQSSPHYHQQLLMLTTVILMTFHFPSALLSFNIVIIIFSNTVKAIHKVLSMEGPRIF